MCLSLGQCQEFKNKYNTVRVKSLYIISRESDSRMSVCLSFRLSVCLLPKPLSLSDLLLSDIKPIDHQAYQPLSLSTIKPIDHQAYRPLSLSSIKPIDHQAY